MPGTAFGLPQLTSLYDPSIAVDQAALERNMAIAQALRQQGMSPIETQGRQIGGMGYRISPLEGVAKIVQQYEAQKMEHQNDAARQDLAQRSMMAMAAMLRDPGAIGAQGATQGSEGSAQGAPTGGGFSLPALLRGNIISSIGGPAMGSAYAKGFEPTDLQREVTAAGIDPNSNLGHQLVQGHIAKENYIAPTSLRPGGYVQEPNGPIHQLPAVPPGFAAVQNPNSPTGFDIVPQPGGLGAVGMSAHEGAYGTGLAHAQTTAAPPQYGGPNGTTVQPTTTVAASIGLPDGRIPPAAQAARDDKRRQMLAAELRGTNDPQARAAISTEIANTQGGQAYPTVPVGTENAQKALDTSWESLKTQNREAMNTSSYLDNIVKAAHSGAIVGPVADRREMIQGILQLAGINEKVNENAVSQTQLLDKYHNQIVTRLGQGGLGTDAARAMLDSAYPGQPMNVAAIDEAAANLKGAQAMVQAKTRFLMEPATKRDSTTYQQREIQFDQNADPRIWQWASIQDPNARKRFLSQTLQQDPHFLDRVKALKAMGALN